MDLYQTGIIITFFLIIAGSIAGAISQMEPGENFGMTDSFSEMTTFGGTQTDINGMVTQINNDFAEASASSNPITKLTVGGGAILNSMLALGQMVLKGLTNWYTLTDILFAFAIGTPLILIKIPIQIGLGIIMVYTLFKLVGDVISHLPFFGGG